MRSAIFTQDDLSELAAIAAERTGMGDNPTANLIYCFLQKMGVFL